MKFSRYIPNLWTMGSFIFLYIYILWEILEDKKSKIPAIVVGITIPIAATAIFVNQVREHARYKSLIFLLAFFYFILIILMCHIEVTAFVGGPRTIEVNGATFGLFRFLWFLTQIVLNFWTLFRFKADRPRIFFAILSISAASVIFLAQSIIFMLFLMATIDLLRLSLTSRPKLA